MVYFFKILLLLHYITLFVVMSIHIIFMNPFLLQSLFSNVDERRRIINMTKKKTK